MQVTAWSIRQSGLEGEHVVTGFAEISVEDELNSESPLVNVVASNDDNKDSIIPAECLSDVIFFSNRIVYDNFGSFICGIILLYPFFVYNDRGGFFY